MNAFLPFSKRRADPQVRKSQSIGELNVAEGEAESQQSKRPFAFGPAAAIIILFQAVIFHAALPLAGILYGDDVRTTLGQADALISIYSWTLLLAFAGILLALLSAARYANLLLADQWPGKVSLLFALLAVAYGVGSCSRINDAKWIAHAETMKAWREVR